MTRLRPVLLSLGLAIAATAATVPAQAAAWGQLNVWSANGKFIRASATGTFAIDRAVNAKTAGEYIDRRADGDPAYVQIDHMWFGPTQGTPTHHWYTQGIDQTGRIGSDSKWTRFTKTRQLRKDADRVRGVIKVCIDQRFERDACSAQSIVTLSY